MKASEFMTPRVVTVEMDDHLDAVRDIFAKTGFHHLLVVERKKLQGVISDRDLLRALSPFIGTMSEQARDLATLNRRAHQIMSHEPIVTNRDASLHEVIGIFLKHRISCVPVVNDANEPVGIISWRDLMKVFDRVLPDL